MVWSFERDRGDESPFSWRVWAEERICRRYLYSQARVEKGPEFLTGLCVIQKDSRFGRIENRKAISTAQA